MKLKMEATPSQQAHLEILALASKPELKKNSVIGGPTPAEMQAENARKLAEHRRQRLAIIARHGVFDEYLAPLREAEKRLASKLAGVRQDITDLEQLRDGR